MKFEARFLQNQKGLWVLDYVANSLNIQQSIYMPLEGCYFCA